MRDIIGRLSELEKRAKPIERITIHFEDGGTKSMNFLDAVSEILGSAALDVFADKFPLDDSTIPRVVDVSGRQSDFINALLGRANTPEVRIWEER